MSITVIWPLTRRTANLWPTLVSMFGCWLRRLPMRNWVSRVLKIKSNSPIFRFRQTKFIVFHIACRSPYTALGSFSRVHWPEWEIVMKNNKVYFKCEALRCNHRGLFWLWYWGQWSRSSRWSWCREGMLQKEILSYFLESSLTHWQQMLSKVGSVMNERGRVIYVKYSMQLTIFLLRMRSP